MDYKYQRRQIFGKRLRVPRHILNEVYNCTLSFNEYIEYQLDDKIPTSCIIESDRKIVERFGIDKCKELDWELINKRANINFRDVLMSIDSQTQDINSALYELVKDEIKPVDYTPKMREVYSDRLFDVSQNNDENLRYIINDFNEGKVGLKEIIYNWDLFKNKDLSYCLLHDNANKNHITDNMLKEFMSSYKDLTSLIIENNDIYTFISDISSLKSEEEKKNFVKQFTDDILNNTYRKYGDGKPPIKPTNEQYKEIFKYSSMEDYLKIFNKYRATPVIEELKSLPQDYVFNMSIPFSELLNYGVLSFVGTYGLKNIVDFDNECGHFFTKNNCEMLKLMNDMYLHYSGNEHDPNKTIHTKKNIDENGNYIDRPYTKDEFYEAMKRMIIYGPSDWNYADKAPDYRDMTGEFRIRNAELFISEEAPEELQKMFYTKSITPQLLLEHPEYIQFLNGKDLSSCLKNRVIQVEGSNALFGYENIYKFLGNKTDFNGVMNFITEYCYALEVIFDTSRQLFNNPLSNDLKINIDNNFIDIKNQFDAIIKSVKFKCVLEYLKIQDVELQKVFKEYVMEFGTNIDVEKIEYVSEVLSRLSLSNSSEIFTFRKELATQILKSNNPLESLNKIEDVFIRNNIPTVGKIYSCFEILHPDFQGFNFESSMVSPVLKKSSTMSKKVTVFSDLIKSSFGSNNKSVNAYLKNIEFGSSLYESLKSGQIQFDSLGDDEMRELTTFCSHLATLYNNTMKAKKSNETFKSTGYVLTDILELSKKLSPDGTLDYNLADRVIRMFCGFTGIDTLEQAKEYIERKVKTADSRNRNASSSDMVLEQGDFIKGIGGITYLRNILQNGSVSKEYLGSSAGSDATPLDTDISMIMSSDGTISEKMGATAASGYGPIWFVLKNDDRFITTRTSSETLEAKRDMSKMEVFYTGVLGQGHYGIRTGFASSEINYIVMDKYDPRVGLEIAMNGFYIPVANKEGKIVFTPKDYDELRAKMSGLSYYGMPDYNLSKNLISEEILETKEKLIQDIKRTNAYASEIKRYICDAVKYAGIMNVVDGFNSDLTQGIAEIYSTGSTSRNTNVPNDSDFDYLIKVDRTIYFNPSKLETFKTKMKTKLGFTDGYGGKICGKIKKDTGDELDVEISFCPRTDKVELSTDTSLSSKLDAIKKQYPDSYMDVLANIVYAKELFKSINAYKSLKSDATQGGLGGIGIENWILQHGGSFYDAAKDFVDEAKKAGSFEEFKKVYQVFDLGDNHYSDKSGVYPHDNFVGDENKMGQDGYNRMLTALKEYLKSIEQAQTDTETIKR